MISEDQRVKRFKTLAELEADIIRRRLEAFRWNKVATAKSLGVAYKTVYNRMRSHGIPIEPPPEFKKQKRYDHTKGTTSLSAPRPVHLRVLPMITFYWVEDGKRYHEDVSPDLLYIPTFNRSLKHVPVIRDTCEGYVLVKDLANLLVQRTTDAWFRG